MEGEREIGLQAQNREEGDESRSGTTNNVEGVGSGNDHDNNEDQEPSRKKYSKHTKQQIHVLESFFKEFPYPDEEQRNNLGMQLGLESRQIKFWFQNKRTQMKEAVSHRMFTNCGNHVAMSSCGSGGINFEIERMRLENAQLKDEFNRICMLASRFLGRPISSSSLSDYDRTYVAAPP
ncbi:hypothetical protein Ddye_013655 [Dipteronia dyeriana]|uniref:Homeobox domain-containing protein n=1 Tax=Dipteronia dyeriana TaxID=168575 RepID=A0AAE0CJV1_9ROSI|nr:hypothetical protein Ddye_013655 [Dipteronia dyeriana]